MKRIYDIIISVTAAASALCISACAEKELLPGTVEEGIPVEATLTFGAPNSDDVTVTTKAELNDYSDITSLYLFIYNTDGTKCEDVIPVAEDQISGGQIVGTGRQYSTTIRTTTGTKRIFAVANYVSVESWVDFRTKIETLGSRAKDGKLTMDEVGKEIVYLRDTYINNGTTPEYPTQQMIFTSRTGGDQVTFNNNGSNNGSSNGVINLERIAANVIFNIRSGSKTNRRISFTPTSYQIYNLPKGTRLAGGRSTEDNPAEADAGFYYDGSVRTITATSTGGTYSFYFFIPENIQKKNPNVTSYNQRDEWKYNSSDGKHTGIPGSDAGTGVGSTNGEKIWKYAPENATYVVISGEYAEYKTTGSGEELLYSGNTSYVIHLGDFSTKESIGDYSVRRNWKYTYNITVKGVNEIIAEANADDGSQGKEPGAEGGLVNISDITLSFSLDAHYEQVLLSYNLSNIVQTIKTSVGDLTDEGIDELIGQNLILYIESPFQATKITKVPYTDYIEAVKGFADPESTEAQKAAALAKERFLSEVDYKWVEFFPQRSSIGLSAYPGLPRWKNNGADINSSSDLNERLLDVYDVCVRLGKVVRKLYDEETVSTSEFAEDGITITSVRSGGSDVYYAYFTGFVDEYYYTEYPVTANGHTAGEPVAKWSEFTNKDPRRMMISMNIQVSGDGNSTYSTAHTNILQRSIQTFYDDEAADMTAFGMETFNETNAMVYQSGSRGNLSYPANTSSYSDTDGRSNTKRLLGLERSRNWNSYINSSDNGHKSSVSGIRKLSDAYKLDAIFTTCLSRNRDLNGNGVIDDNELRWYMPAVNEYIRMGMGANAIPNEAQLYVGDKSALTLDGYPSSFISNGALYHTSTYGGAKVTFWAVEKGSYGDQMSTYNGGRYMIRCIRILPDDVDAESGDWKVSAAIYQEKVTSNENYLFDFRGRLTPSLFRQVRNTAPYNFLQHDEDDERNRFYDGLVLAKNYMSNGWSTWGAVYKEVDGENVVNEESEIYNTLKILQNIGNNQSNPCASYHEAGEPANAGWRLPNLVEMTVLASNYDKYIADGMPNRGQGNLPCCTQFSNWAVRQAFYVNTREMVTCGDDYNSHQNFYIRCVRDATDEELATATASSN